MGWLVAAVIGIISAIILIIFLTRFFIKPNSQTALIRTGLGGQKVAINTGIIVLPFLHHLEKINLKSHCLNISLNNEKSIITKDCMRVDIELTFYVRVNNNPANILTASQIYGMTLNRTEDFVKNLYSKLANATYSAAAQIVFMDLLDKRNQLIAEISNQLTENFSKNGLVLESVNIRHFDQTLLGKLDQNNAFNAIGLKQLTAIITKNKQATVEIEASSETSIKQTQLALTRKNLSIEFEQRQAQLTHNETLRNAETRSTAKIGQISIENDRQLQEVKISEAHKIELIKIANDQKLRQQELGAILTIEEDKSNNEIKRVALKESELFAQIKLQEIETKQLLAFENSQTQKQVARENREKQIALLQAEQAHEVNIKHTQSHTEELLSKAQMQAELEALSANNLKLKLLAEAEGNAALIASENTQSDAIIAQKTTKYQLDIMPEIARQMMKPVEKIESIKINHISGIGHNSVAKGSDGNNQLTAFDQALDSILGMSVSLPMMKKIGAEIGLDMDAQTATRLSDAASRSKAPQKQSTKLKNNN